MSRHFLRSFFLLKWTEISGVHCYTPENEHGGPQNDAIFEAGKTIILGMYVKFRGGIWRIIPVSKWLISVVSKSPK